MKIKSKISLVIFVSILAYSLPFFYMHNLILFRELKSEEIHTAHRDISRILLLLNNEKKHLQSNCYDYAIWDDSYNFINNCNEHYIDTNLNDTALNNLDLSFIAYLNKDKELVYEKTKNKKGLWERTENIDSSRIFTDGLNNNPALSGLIEINGLNLLFNCHAIQMSELTDKSNGYLIMGKSLSRTARYFSEKDPDINFSFTGLEEESETGIAAIKDLMMNIENKEMIFNVGEDTVFIEVNDSQTINSYSSLKSVNGEDLSYLKVETPRKINAIALKAFDKIKLMLIFATILIPGLVYLFLSLTISRPLEQLSVLLQSFKPENRTYSNNEVPFLTWKNEIGSVARSFDKMKQNTIENNLKIIALNKNLESKVSDKTRKLEEVNNALVMSEIILREASEGICITNEQGDLIKVNNAFCKISGYTKEELLGKNPRVLKSDRHDPDFYKYMWESIINEGYWNGEIWDRKKNGEVYPKLLTINKISTANSKEIFYFGISTDMSQIKKSENEIKKLAYYDALTGLPNRVHFYEILERSVVRSTRFEKLTVLLFLDLDRFKMVNDTLGHSAGDLVLLEVAKRLRMIVKNTDTVARLGGDEFTIILEDIDINQELESIVKRIITDISRPVQILDTNVQIGASIGITIAPSDGTTVEDLVMKADSAMFYSKDQGRGQFSFYSKDIQNKNDNFSNMEKKIRKALEKNEFELFLQPKILLKDEKRVIYGAEALIRMNPPDEPMIMPDKFIPVAEDTGLIVRMGDWVIEEACRMIGMLKSKGISTHIAVNVSVKQLRNRKIVDIVKNAIRENNISAEDIEIEITESVFSKDMNKTIRILNELKSLGLRISIDDFGTGYSSLSALSRLPIDSLKIDKSFVDKLGIVAEKELVTSIIAISKNLDLSVVAEGVESEEQMEILSKQSPIGIQGYHFSKPLKFESFMDYYTNFAS